MYLLWFYLWVDFCLKQHTYQLFYLKNQFRFIIDISKWPNSFLFIKMLWCYLHNYLWNHYATFVRILIASCALCWSVAIVSNPLHLQIYSQQQLGYLLLSLRDWTVFISSIGGDFLLLIPKQSVFNLSCFISCCSSDNFRLDMKFFATALNKSALLLSY